MGVKERKKANKMLWASLTIITVIVMGFVYLIIYIREANYLFPISKAEYTNVENMIEEKTKAELPQNSNIIFIYDRFGIPNNDDIFIILEIPALSEYKYVVPTSEMDQEKIFSTKQNLFIKLSYTSGDDDKLTSYMREHGKDQIAVITPVYIIACLLVLLMYFKIYRCINKRITSIKNRKYE